MLVLSRKSEEKIRIGKDIVITVLKVQGDQVSIGIQAPRDLHIIREELLEEDLAKETAQLNRQSVRPDLGVGALPQTASE